MKHKWEYKRLGEVCEVIGGSTPKTDNPDFWDGQLNWFTPAEINNEKYYSSSQRKITPQAVKSAGLTLMPKGTVLFTSRAPIGKIGIATEECYCNQGFKCLVCKEGTFNEYLYYALQYFNDDIKDKGRGATFKEISKTVTESITLPFPPLDYQKRIVKELDEINGMIEGRNEQIKLLDQLSQSIFYEMFGDPISNPKGWEVKNFEENIEKTKYPNKLNTSDYLDNGRFPIVSQEENLISGYTNREDCVFKIESPVIIFGDHTRCLKYVDFNFALGADGVKILKPLNIYPWYLFYSIRLFKIPSLGYSRHYRLLKELKVPIPPISLQNEFATKVELIEEQKREIENSIKELETFLASRMDYWFN